MKYKKEIIIGGVIVAILIISFVFASYRKKAEAPIINQPIITETLPMVESPKTPVVIKKEKVESNMTYTEAFMKYKNKYIMQFSENCQAVPTNLIVLKGSSMMLDNRSKKSEVIRIGDNKYELGPYGFKIVTITASKVPTVYTIDCNTAQNVSTLTVE